MNQCFHLFGRTAGKRMLTIVLFALQYLPAAAADNNFHLMLAPGTLSAGTATLLWYKPEGVDSAVYTITLNGKRYGTTTKTNYALTALTPGTHYTVRLSLANGKNKAQAPNTLTFTTAAKSQLFNILDYGAKADSAVKNTKAIQAAIDACTAGGTVYIPKGTFMSGALFLKSDMTLYVEKGGILKGSADPDDYLPMTYNRFEGWELDTYASLLNAGTLNRNGTYNVNNLRITGGGTISGGGRKLGDAMTKAHGLRSRGRLILLMNCHNVAVSDLIIREAPCWNIHYIYSDDITCSDLDITSNVHNGDGIDPDSSTDSYIFNCTFNTSDDCIAIKSGKNPEGFTVGKPTTNVRITDCDFKKGHGISIGSEMSGGVSGVLVQNCKAGNLLHGMQIKGTKERGGYVRNVTVTHCQLLKITILSAVNYNNDGEAAPESPIFENFTFKNIDMTGANTNEPVVNINGFKETGHQLKHVSFSNITLPANAKVVINDAQQVSFTNVTTTAGVKPQYIASNSTDIVY